MSLPPEMLRRVPVGHTFHRWTGTVEYLRTQTGSGQRNFILHPIAGEEETCLNSQRLMLVTDLDMEKVNGHRIVLFAFVQDDTGEFETCFAYSRGHDSWLMLHDLRRLPHLFSAKNASTGSKLFNALMKTAFGEGSVTLLPINPLSGKPMSAPEIHQLLLDIRAHLMEAMNRSAKTNGLL